ncbi:hypothetical protein BSKO_08580 [Bryopsis sp. KO-2023]|nr:hypothetical protein BSKO_08580 [Bryopsis sp. KO-2023]
MDEERRCICFFFTKEKALKLFQSRAVGSPPFDYTHDQGADVEVKSASKIGEVAGYFVDVRGKAHQLQLAFNNFCTELGYEGSTDESEEWEYLDDSFQYQGPFSKNRIRGWTKAGHLDPAKMMRNTKMDSWASVQSLLNLDLAVGTPLIPKLPQKPIERGEIEEWQISTGWTSQATPTGQRGGVGFGRRGSSEQSENTPSSNSANNELAPPPNLTGCSQIGYTSTPASSGGLAANKKASTVASMKPSGWGPPPKEQQSTRMTWGNSQPNRIPISQSQEEAAPKGVISQQPEQAPSRGRSESSGYGPNSPRYPQNIVSTPSQMSTPPPSIGRSSDLNAPNKESTVWGPQPVVQRTSSIGWAQPVGSDMQPSATSVQQSSSGGWGPEPKAVKTAPSRWGPGPTVQKSPSGWGSQPRLEETRPTRPVINPVQSAAPPLRSIAEEIPPTRSNPTAQQKSTGWGPEPVSSATPPLRSVADENPPARSNPTVQKKPTGWGPEPVKLENSSIGWGMSQAKQTPDEKEPVDVPQKQDGPDGSQWMSNSNQRNSAPEGGSAGAPSQNRSYDWAFGGPPNQAKQQNSNDSQCQDGWRQDPEQDSGDGWGGIYGGVRGQGFSVGSGHRGRGGGMGRGDDRQNSGHGGYGGGGWGDSGNRSWDDRSNRDDSGRGRGTGRGIRGRGWGSFNEFGRREGQHGHWESGTDGNPTRNRSDRPPGYSYGRVASEILEKLNSAGGSFLGTSQEWQELLTKASEVLVTGISPFLKHLLQLEYGDMWSDIVLIKPPWTCADLLRVMAKHWNSILSPLFSRLVFFQRDELEFLLKKSRREGATVEDTLRFLSCAKHMLSVLHYPSDEQLQQGSPKMGAGPQAIGPDVTKEEIVENMMEARRVAYDLQTQCADRIRELLGETGHEGYSQQSGGWGGSGTRNEGVGWSGNQPRNPQEEETGKSQSESAPKGQQCEWGPASTQTSNCWSSGNQENNAERNTGWSNEAQPDRAPATKNTGWSSAQPSRGPEPKISSWSDTQPDQTPAQKKIGWSSHTQPGQASEQKSAGWSGAQRGQTPEGQQQGMRTNHAESLNDIGATRLGGGGWGPFKSPAPPVIRGWVENTKPQGTVESDHRQSGPPDSRPRGWTNNVQSQGGSHDGGTKLNENDLKAAHAENYEAQNHSEERDGGCRGRGFDESWNERGSPIQGRSIGQGLRADNPQPQPTSGNYQPYPENVSEDRWKKADIISEPLGEPKSEGFPAETQNNDSHMGENAGRGSESFGDPSDQLWNLTLEEAGEVLEIEWTWVRGITAAYPLKGVEGKDVLASIRDSMKGVAAQAKHTGAIDKMNDGERAAIKKSIDHIFSVADALTQIKEEIENDSKKVSVPEFKIRLRDFLTDIYSPCMLGTTVSLLSKHDEGHTQRFLAELEKWVQNSMAVKMVQFFRFIGTTLEEMMRNKN